jgi:hypothetical protein
VTVEDRSLAVDDQCRNLASGLVLLISTLSPGLVSAATIDLSLAP